MKIRQNNDMTDCIDLIYVKIEIEMSEPIWLGAVYDENQTRQRLDRSCKCILC